MGFLEWRRTEELESNPIVAVRRSAAEVRRKRDEAHWARSIGDEHG